MAPPVLNTGLYIIKMNTRFFLKNGLPVLIFLLLVACQPSAEFTIGGKANNTLWLAPTEPEYVRRAVQDLIGDVKKITGNDIALVEQLEDCSGNCFVITTIGNESMADLLPPDRVVALQGKWEQYALYSVPNRNQLLITGSNPRGTMFGIYHFLEYQLGVDPLYFWTGYEPEKREEIVLKEVDYMSTEPDFKFRGWFINDEDLLTEWKDGGGVRQIDYPYYGQVVAPEVIDEVIEAAVRLRYNMIIPASFIDIRNPAEERLVAAASQRGLFVSMHHIEPLGVSAFGYQNYWKEKGESPLFSFYSEPQKLEQTWREYARRWAQYPDVIWQIGLRGIADRPMWLADPGVPQSDADRARIISDAMTLQKQIIEEVTGEKKPLMSTTLWAEGAVFNQKGLLEIPSGVMVIFADNSPGWVWQADFYETQRTAGQPYGVYFHHQLWGSGPHLVQAVPPARTFQMFQEAMASGAQEYAMMNVSNIREFPLALAASSAMLWDMESFQPDHYLKNWCTQRFPEAPDQTAAAYQAFFDSYQLVGERQIPGFLDGQQRGRGLSILNEIKKQRERGDSPQSPAGKKANKSSDAFHKSLSDTNPAGGLPLAEILPQVQQQIADLAQAQGLAEAALPRLTGEAKTLFESNLIAQIKILSGLGNWLEACILAKQAADAHDLATAKAHLQTALAAFELIHAGQQLATNGKWQDWYRGDKKMNLRSVELQTREIAAFFE